MTRTNETEREMTEMNESNHNTRNTVIAFTLGAIAGGVAAFLTAPKKGAEMRRRLVDGTGELVHDTKDKVTKTAHDVGETVRGRKDAVKQAARAAKDAYREEMQHANGGAEQKS